jgi:sec-independent protein translocase protein TatA
MFPRIGVPELILILVIVLVVFGVGKLPQIGGAVGKAISEFRKAQSGKDIDDELSRKSTANAEVMQSKK